MLSLSTDGTTLSSPPHQDLEALVSSARKGMESAADQAEEQRHKVARLQEALK
jgi:hypothetical protein